MLKINFYLLSIVLLLHSCSSSDDEIRTALTGTWVLSQVEGNCSGLAINVNADIGGCVDLPVIEVNCAIMELAIDGSLTYAYNSQKGVGSYSVDGNVITICTDRCLDYVLENNELTMQTGTIAVCDPIYHFTMSQYDLESIIELSQKRISKVRRNGILHEAYEYDNEGRLIRFERYDDNGTLEYYTIYEFLMSKLKAVTYAVNSSFVVTYEYYEHAEGISRRDRYFNDDFINYRLYYQSEDKCWIDKSETYSNEGELESIRAYNYRLNSCDYDLVNYDANGAVTGMQTFIYDNEKAWNSAVSIQYLERREKHNVISVRVFNGQEIFQASSYNSTFNYDAEGYPEFEIRRYLDGNDEEYRFEYE